jgi:hypothetical protein
VKSDTLVTTVAYFARLPYRPPYDACYVRGDAREKMLFVKSHVMVLILQKTEYIVKHQNLKANSLLQEGGMVQSACRDKVTECKTEESRFDS